MVGEAIAFGAAFGIVFFGLNYALDKAKPKSGKPDWTGIDRPKVEVLQSKAERLVQATVNSKAVTMDDEYFFALEADRKNKEREVYANSGGRADRASNTDD